MVGSIVRDFSIEIVMMSIVLSVFEVKIDSLVMSSLVSVMMMVMLDMRIVCLMVVVVVFSVVFVLWSVCCFWRLWWM